MRTEGGLREPDWGPVRHPADGTLIFPPLFFPPFFFVLIQPIEGSLGKHGDNAVINPELVSGALAFHLNMYLHPHRCTEGSPFKSPNNVPKSETADREMINDTEYDFYLSSWNVFILDSTYSKVKCYFLPHLFSRFLFFFTFLNFTFITNLYTWSRAVIKRISPPHCLK